MKSQQVLKQGELVLKDKQGHIKKYRSQWIVIYILAVLPFFAMLLSFFLSLFLFQGGLTYFWVEILFSLALTVASLLSYTQLRSLKLEYIEKGSPSNEEEGEPFKIMIIFPEKLSKGHATPFHLIFYPPFLEEQVVANPRFWIKQSEAEILSLKSDFSLYKSLKVETSFFSPDIMFSAPVLLEFSKKPSIKVASFIAKPRESCKVGLHAVKVAVIEINNRTEIFSYVFQIKVIDFAFDHISRPLLSTFSAILSGVGGGIMYILTLLSKVDMALGLTSGTAAFLLGFWLRQIANTYSSPKKAHIADLG